MEYSYAMDHSSNSSGISIVASEFEDLIESSPPATFSQSGPEGSLRINTRITLPVSIVGDSDSVYRERSTSL